jgi:hypothetical protein
MSGPANGEGPPRLHKRSPYARAEAGETSWRVRAGVQNTRHFKAAWGGLPRQRRSRQGINADRNPPRSFPLGANNASSLAFGPRAGLRRDQQGSRNMPKLRKPTTRACQAFAYAEGYARGPPSVTGKARQPVEEPAH